MSRLDQLVMAIDSHLHSAWGSVAPLLRSRAGPVIVVVLSLLVLAALRRILLGEVFRGLAILFMGVIVLTSIGIVASSFVAFGHSVGGASSLLSQIASILGRAGSS